MKQNFDAFHLFWPPTGSLAGTGRAMVSVVLGLFDMGLEILASLVMPVIQRSRTQQPSFVGRMSSISPRLQIRQQSSLRNG
jgi:hypothetical protein